MGMGVLFRELHIKGNPLMMPNAWDIGSAKVMVALGAKAIATSSAAHAFTLGRPDMGTVTRDETLAHAQDLVSAVNVPVSGDFENGFGDDPEIVAETVRLAGEIGLAGCCIEDTKLPSTDAYDFDLAIERIKAGASAARTMKNDFVFCARADGIMNNIYDCDEAIRRLQAFEAAGADVLYAPLPESFLDLKRICKSVEAPVNVLLAGEFRKNSIDDFGRIGAARISLGSTLARAMHYTLVETTSKLLANDFTSLLQTANGDEIDAMLGPEI